MSDQEFDGLLAGLADEQPESNRKATSKQPARGAQKPRKARTRKAEGSKTPRPKRETGTSDQRGRRKPEERDKYAQINASIRKDLKPSLFFYLKVEGKTLSEVIEELLERWVDERGGEFVPATRKRPK